MEHAKKIVAEFEDVFGKLSATERDWLTRRIAEPPPDVQRDIISKVMIPPAHDERLDKANR